MQITGVYESPVDGFFVVLDAAHWFAVDARCGYSPHGPYDTGMLAGDGGPNETFEAVKLPWGVARNPQAASLLRASKLLDGFRPTGV